MRLRPFIRWVPSSAAVVLAVAACSPAPAPPSLAGQWEATVTVNDIDIPFLFEIGHNGDILNGTFFNGELRITSTAGRFEHDTMSLAFGLTETPAASLGPTATVRSS